MDLVKLGGSVVTDKARELTADRAAIRAVGRALVRHPRPRVLVHGTGSFGKPYAIRYDYLEGRFDAGLVERYLEIRNSLLDLGRIVARELAAAGLPAAELDAAHCFARDAASGELSFAEPEHFGLLLERGAVPVLRGELFVCARDGYRVVSSDAMIVALARRLRPERALFLTDVPGALHPRTGELLPELDAAMARELDAEAAAGSDALDVSGGMSAKARWALEAAERAGECWILDGRDAANLEAALAGDGRPFRGTRVVAGESG